MNISLDPELKVFALVASFIVSVSLFWVVGAKVLSRYIIRLKNS